MEISCGRFYPMQCQASVHHLEQIDYYLNHVMFLSIQTLQYWFILKGEGWVDIPHFSGILLSQVSTVGNTKG